MQPITIRCDAYHHICSLEVLKACLGESNKQTLLWAVPGTPLLVGHPVRPLLDEAFHVEILRKNILNLGTTALF